MSVAPQRTVSLSKDFLFQEKHNLSHSQMDLMAYCVNLSYWAICIDGYFVITTSKVMSDLPQMGLKTFEASLKVLKDFGLVECKIVEVTQWKGNPKVRGLKLTTKGEGYNGHLMLPSQDKRVRELEKEIKKLKETIANLTVKKEEESHKETPKPQEIDSEPTPTPQPKLPPKDKIDEFIQQVTKQFGANSKPICNLAPKYHKENTFYINSYNKVSMITPYNDMIQLANPKQIHEFWQWLYINSHRVGDKIDFSITPTIEELKQRFVNRTIKIKGERHV